MKNKLIILLIYMLLFFYTAGFMSFGLPLIFFGFLGLIGFYLITARLRTILMLFSNKELIIIFLIFFTYLIFSQRLSIWHLDDKNFFKQLVYAFHHIVLLFFIAIYGFKNKDNRIILTRAFAIVLISSLVFFSIGSIFPEEFLNLRYVLYQKYYDYLIDQGVLNKSIFFLAGFAPGAHIFGYQIAGGFLIISLFFVEKNNTWKLIWGACSILLLVVAVIFGERSIVPAFAVGLLSFIVLSPKKKIKNRKTFNERFILIAFFVISLLLILRIIYLNEKRNIEDNPVALIHERFKSGDIRIRLGMQLAAMQIILEQPLGLFWRGINEEDWGYIANEKGYEVIPDANNIDYALVHNAYLRLVMYFGLQIALPIIVVLSYILKKLKYFKVQTEFEDSSEKRYGRAVAACLVTLLIQAMFHNNSLFTFEKTTWIAFCLFIIWVKPNRHVVAYKQQLLTVNLHKSNG